ncbi:glycosyltransferase family 2 protein [Streptacidiphilus sp. N1-12]|uniref:Glycosyltransferase family 2 protein n=2 Tax=Streptacidiphilus alkalitolerans TaxID=3342712 RepID=A0ABV6WIR7_9ACTN
MSAVDDHYRPGAQSGGDLTALGDPTALEEFGAPLFPSPSVAERFTYLRRNAGALALCSLVSFGCLGLSQVNFMATSPWLLLYLPFFALTTVYFLASLWVNGFGRSFRLREHEQVVAAWQPAVHPSVDVFLPVCGEPLAVLHNTWHHVRLLAHRYPGTVRPMVLDDSASAEVRELAASFDFDYTTRPDRGWFKKAGNLRHGFARSDGDFILILDADFCPSADLLDELLPYLAADPRIGIVQSPQHFRVLSTGQNWIERGAGAIQELFYRNVQVSRQHHGAAICVGSCAVYRRAALDEIGGTALIEHSEDVHTGFALGAAGWKLRYVPLVLATGLCPDNLTAFYRQQYRWCTGSLSMMTSPAFWRTKLRPVARLCYASGFLHYIQTAASVFMAPLVPLTLLFALPHQMRFENSLLALPAILYTTVVFPRWHRCRYGLEAWAAKLVCCWAHVFAITDLLRRRPEGWQPTGAASSGSGRHRLRLGLIGWSGSTALLWLCAATWRMCTLRPEDFLLLTVSGVGYTATVIRALIPPSRPAP